MPIYFLFPMPLSDICRSLFPQIRQSDSFLRLFCRNEACGLRIFKNSFGHTLTDEEMKMLVTKGKTKKMTLVNKVGKEYEAFLYIDPDNKEVKVDFPKKK